MIKQACRQACRGYSSCQWTVQPVEFTTWRAVGRLTQGAGQKEVSCAGQRAPARTARAALGVSAARLAALTPPRVARAAQYGILCMAADSCDVMGMLWGHFGMCARVLRAARSWPAHAAPRSSPVFAGSRSSSMLGAAGVVSVVGNVPSCVPGGRDASREDLQIGVDESGLYVVLIKQLLHCVLIKQLLIARAVSKRAPIKPWRATQAKILRVRLASLAASSILHVGLMRSSLRPRVWQ